MLILSAVQSRKCDYFAMERAETKKGDAKKQELWKHCCDPGAEQPLEERAGFPKCLSDAIEMTPKVFSFH